MPDNENENENGYTPPASQDELDRIIQERVARAKDSALREFAEKYPDLDKLDAYRENSNKLKELEQKGLSAEQLWEQEKNDLLAKLSEKDTTIASVQKELEDERLEKIRSEVALTKNIPATQLRGFSTKEEMEAEADRLIEWAQERASNAESKSKSRSKIRSGAGGGTVDRDKLTPKERAALKLRGELE
ncbi:head scaffolding protein [Gordonia phage Ronaldo]|uniref:Scaffolding protein n=4 Tax=Ronaldovirus TaxID=2733205 RepID=A0A6B9L8I4_9CAUD|nr:head scaffolding protein [Gordonia phage Fryberger]YP_009807737.1 head scaffolding protein [Gordonia phage Ronaldo]QDH48380.1 scaffolding protein [Gordonia phage Ziko]QHB38156.1 scaffolding protein [Gordonia phage Volt]AXN53456.1 scaffolding protein [Gordonia phage Fryberger]AXN53603.1 scaffolding protein [Gordonia phage Ronaldo]